MADTLHARVEAQFGPRAAAYLASAVHAQGADLAQLAALVAAHPGGRVLDLGCGAGHVSFAAAPHAAEVVAYDLSERMLAVVAEAAAARGLANITTQRGPAEHLPFADGSFDLVLSRFSAHHWRDWEAGLREARRVLRPGGRAGFADAVSPGTPLADTFLQAIEVLRDPSHVRDYGVAEWLAACARAGFAAESVTTGRLRLDFAEWTARMATPPLQVQAIRALHEAMPAEARAALAVEPDGSFLLDTAVFILA